MSEVLKLVGSEMTLTTANNVSTARLVRLQETGGLASSVITQKTADGSSTIGTVTLYKGTTIVVEKAPTDTLASSAGTVVAVPVAYRN